MRTEMERDRAWLQRLRVIVNQTNTNRPRPGLECRGRHRLTLVHFLTFWWLRSACSLLSLKPFSSAHPSSSSLSVPPARSSAANQASGNHCATSADSFTHSCLLKKRSIQPPTPSTCSSLHPRSPSFSVSFVRKNVLKK